MFPFLLTSPVTCPRCLHKFNSNPIAVHPPALSPTSLVNRKFVLLQASKVSPYMAIRIAQHPLPPASTTTLFPRRPKAPSVFFLLRLRSSVHPPEPCRPCVFSLRPTSEILDTDGCIERSQVLIRERKLDKFGPLDYGHGSYPFRKTFLTWMAPKPPPLRLSPAKISYLPPVLRPNPPPVVEEKSLPPRTPLHSFIEKLATPRTISHPSPFVNGLQVYPQIP